MANGGIFTSNLSFHLTQTESVSCIDLPQTSKIHLKVRCGETAHIHTGKAHTTTTCLHKQPTHTKDLDWDKDVKAPRFIYFHLWLHVFMKTEKHQNKMYRKDSVNLSI